MKVFFSHSYYLTRGLTELTDKNYVKCAEDFLTAPGALYYTANSFEKNSSIGYFRLFNAEQKKKIACIFQGFELEPIEVNDANLMDKGKLFADISFSNSIGSLDIVRYEKSIVILLHPYENHFYKSTRSVYAAVSTDSSTFDYMLEMLHPQELDGSEKVPNNSIDMEYFS